MVSVNKHRFSVSISFVRISYTTIWLKNDLDIKTTENESWKSLNWYFPKDAHQKSEGESVRSDLRKLDSVTDVWGLIAPKLLTILISSTWKSPRRNMVVNPLRHWFNLSGLRVFLIFRKISFAFESSTLRDYWVDRF